MPSSVGTTRKGRTKKPASFDPFTNNLEEQRETRKKEQKKKEEFKELKQIFKNASKIENEGNNYRGDNYLSRLETLLENLKEEKKLESSQLEELEELFNAAIQARNSRRKKEDGGFKHREPAQYTSKNNNNKNNNYNGGGKRRRSRRARRATRKH